MERYPRVKGGNRVDAIAAALRASGGTVMKAADPTVAPFEFRVRTAEGETLDLVCYAFTANKYEQDGRPVDEHRFQVKYGSQFDRPHRIWIDPTRERVTLMFGVHDSRPLFVAVDPGMHSPTWFSSSVEFKEKDLRAAETHGWHGWIRERVSGGRRRTHLPFDLRTETVVAFRPEHFVTYALFERIASGMDAGERSVLIERIGELLRTTGSASSLLRIPRPDVRELVDHPLLSDLGLTPGELLEVLGGRFRLLAAVRGGVAEFHLEKLLRSVTGVIGVERFDQDAQPDFLVRYRGSEVRIECKNVLKGTVGGAPKVDFQKTRAAKGNHCSRYYRPEQFEILAACLHPVTRAWEFRFCATRTLDPHPQCRGHLSQNVKIRGDNWTDQIAQVLDVVAN